MIVLVDTTDDGPIGVVPLAPENLISEVKAVGYFVSLHVVMVPEVLSVERVARRVAAGGHRVPLDKIRERYRRLWALVVQAIALADEATCWDNSRHEGAQAVALFAIGVLLDGPRWPPWTPDALTASWPRPAWIRPVPSQC